MTKQDARKLPPAKQQALRMQAVQLAQEGKPQVQISRELGVSRSTVAGWIFTWRRRGETALASLKRGRPKGTGALSSDEKKWLVDVLCNHTPEQSGLNTHIWSNIAIRDLLQIHWGLSVTKTTASLWMRQWGFIAPVPTFGAFSEYDDDISASAVWRLANYPRIKRLARRQKAKILLFDERPMTEHPFHILSAVDGRGMLRFAVVHLPVTPQERTGFVERLATECRRPIFLLLDSHPNHDNGPIHRWQRHNAGRVTLCYIPIRDLALLPAQCWPFNRTK